MHEQRRPPWRQISVTVIHTRKLADEIDTPRSFPASLRMLTHIRQIVPSQWHAPVPVTESTFRATARAAAAVSATPIVRAVGDTAVRLTRAVLTCLSRAADVSAGAAVVEV